MPIGSRQAQSPSLPEKLAMLKRQAQEAGRDPESISISIFGTQPDADLIGRMEAAGVDRIIFSMPTAEKAEVLPLIDQCAKLI